MDTRPLTPDPDRPYSSLRAKRGNLGGVGPLYQLETDGRKR